MARDPRGVMIRRNDLVAWFGRIPGEKQAVRLGVVDGFGWLGGVKVSEILHGKDGEWRTTGVVASVKADRIMVVDDVPESPYE